MNFKAKYLKKIIASLVLVMLPIMQGCPAYLAYVIVTSYTNNDFVTITVEIPRSADDVFEAALKRASEGHKKSFIVKKVDKDKHFIRAENKEDNWWLELTIVPITENKSQLMMIGMSPGDETTQKNRGLVAVENICKDIGVSYKVIEETGETGGLLN